MLPPNPSSRILCLLLAIGLAWPVPFASSRPADRVGCAGFLADEGATARTFRLAASPRSSREQPDLSAADCDLDDAEDSDDQPVARRLPCAPFTGGRRGHDPSAGATAGAPRRYRLDPSAARPRSDSLRC